MSANARTTTLTHGHSVVGSKRGKASKRGSWLDRVRPYFGLIVALLIMLILYLEKGRLIAFIDHDVSEVRVTGELAPLTHGSIQSQVQPWLESSFLMADLSEIKKEVVALPWVFDSQVSRVWPGQLVVNAIEQVPVVIWNEKHYLNAFGQVFSPEVLTWSEPLVALRGPEGLEDVDRVELLQAIASLNSLLESEGLSATKVNVSSRGSWEVELATGIELAIGKPPFDAAIERVSAVFNGAPERTRTQIERMDTRYPNGLAIKWKEGSHPE